MATQEIFACTGCSKSFSERRRLTQHKKSHSRPYKCETCSKGFASRTDLTRHVNSAHRIGKTIFRCTSGHCSFSSTRKDNLAQHSRTVHERHMSVSKQHATTFKRLRRSSSEGQDAIRCAHSRASGPTFRWKLIMDAASTGNLTLMDNALGETSDVNVVAPDGYTALHCAAKTGQVLMISHLLNKEALVNQGNPKVKGRRPIEEAFIAKHVDAFTLLLHAGANPLLPDSEKRTIIDRIVAAEDLIFVEALFQADLGKEMVTKVTSRLAISSIKLGKCDILRWVLSAFSQLVPQSDDLTRSVSRNATQMKDEAILKMLHESSEAAEVDFGLFISRSLRHTAKNGAIGIAKILIECDSVDVNLPSTYDCWTALHHSSSRGDREMTELLLSHQAIKINVRDKRRDRTPLHLAVATGHPCIVQILLAQPGIDSWCKDGQGITPLGLAFSCYRWDALSLIAEHQGNCLDLDVEADQEELSTASAGQFLKIANELLDRSLLPREQEIWFYIARQSVVSGILEVLKFLTDRVSFDVNSRLCERRQNTALHIAAQNHQHDILRWLLNHPKVNVNARRFSNQIWYQEDSVLHCAVRSNCQTAVQLLLAHPEIDVTRRNYRGCTPLNLARTLERHEFVELLEQHIEARNVPKMGMDVSTSIACTVLIAD